MFRLIIAGFIGGAVLVYFGFQEFRVSDGTTTEPESIESNLLEKDGKPKNNHLKIGDHLAVYDTGVYTYREIRGVKPGPSTSIDHYFYPLISENHPYFVAYDKLALKFGGYDKIPNEEPRPKIKNFQVLIKTEKFKTLGAIPDEPKWEDSISGLIINDVESLEDEDIKFLRESYPELDVENVLILEEDRKPATAAKSFGMMGGGLAIILASGGFMYFRYRKENQDEMPDPFGDVSPMNSDTNTIQ